MEIKPIIKQDYIILNEDTAVSEMIGKLRNEEKRSALVFKNKKYLGLVEKKKLLRTRLDSTETKIHKYIQNTPIVNEKADVLETALLMYGSNVEFLPVEKDKVVVGVVEGLSLASLAANLPEAKRFTVKDVKLTKPAKINKDDPIAMVIDLMHDQSVDPVPVFDQGKLYGVISYKDILRRYLNWSPKRDISVKFNKMASSRSAEVDMPHLASLPVKDFSTNNNLITITLKDSLKTAADLMNKNNILGLLVMDEEEFLGVLTVKNILQLLGHLNPVENYTVKYVGLHELKLQPHQREAVGRVVSSEAGKLQRLINNTYTLIVHIKEYNKGGKQNKFSVHMRIEYPGKIITCAQDDWKIETALHKTFDNAQKTLENMFKDEGKNKNKISLRKQS